MSCSPRRAVLFVPIILLLTLALRQRAHADTYEFFTFTDYSGAARVIGVDDTGDVVSRLLETYCGNTATSCYYVFQAFGPGYLTATLPPLTLDDGTPCSPNPHAAFGTCNNGYEAYWIDLSGSNPGIYGGPYTDVQQFPFLIADFAPLVDSYGDIAWTDGSVEESHLAYDLTSHQTPEPATFALLLTGFILFAAITSRKLIRARKTQTV
jgi:hypothetical protein